MKRSTSSIVFMPLAVILALASPAASLEKCKATLKLITDRDSGATERVVLVSANDVQGPLMWGYCEGAEDNPVYLDLKGGTCGASGKAKNCTLAAPGDAKRSLVPSDCVFSLADDLDSCQVTLKSRDCTEGLRQLGEANCTGFDPDGLGDAATLAAQAQAAAAAAQDAASAADAKAAAANATAVSASDKADAADARAALADTKASAADDRAAVADAKADAADARAQAADGKADAADAKAAAADAKAQTADGKADAADGKADAALTAADDALDGLVAVEPRLDCVEAGGVGFGGACWFRAVRQFDCGTWCGLQEFVVDDPNNPVSLVYDEATKTFAGSGGSDENCRKVLNAFGQPGDSVISGQCTTIAPVLPPGMGCFHSQIFGRVRCTDETFADRGDGSSERACACKLP